MSYDIVKSLSIKKRKDGYSYRGSFAASNVTPQYFTSEESKQRWKSRNEVDLFLAWHWWNGNLQGGKTEWAVRDDIARILDKRAGVKHLSVDYWRDDDDTHNYGSPIAVMENVIFPAARDLYALWKQAAGKYALVDDDGGFVYKITTRRNYGTTIKRSSSPTFWNARDTGYLKAKIALEAPGYNLEFRCVSESDVTNAKQEIVDETGLTIPSNRDLAKRLFDNAPQLFEKEWEWCAKQYPALLNGGEVISNAA